MYKVSSRWPHQDSVKVEWNLSKRCNYDCSYCPESIHDNTSPHTDIEILKSTVDKLVTLGKPIRLSFTGGEPCVHPKFKELVTYCKHVGINWINVTTNGTLPIKFYSSLPVDHMVFSLHFEHDHLRVMSTIINVHSQVTFPIIVNVMAHHKYIPSVKMAVSDLSNHNVPHVVRRVRWTEDDHNVFDDMRYDGKDLEWLLNYNSTAQPNCVINDDRNQMYHANDIIKLHKNGFKGWSCNAGIESLMINWDGEVHRATCRVGGSLGNIYTGTFVVPNEPVNCTRDWCTCAADIPLTKIKNEDADYQTLNLVT